MTNRFSRRSILSVCVLVLSLLTFLGCKESIDELSPLSVAYNGNGNGSGEPPIDSHIYQKGDTVVVLAQGSMVKTGYDFTGWSDSSSATQVAYVAGSNFQMPATSITLFAVWTPKAVQPATTQPGTTPTTGQPATGDQPGTTQPGTTQPGTTQPGTTPTTGQPATGDQTGTTQPGTTQPGTTPTTGDQTSGSCTVSFNTDDGSSVVAQPVTSGQKVTRPADPTKSGYTFGGWYRDQERSTAWNFDTDTVSSTMTLYAKWTAETAPSKICTVTYFGNGSDGGTVPVDANEYEPGASTSILWKGTLSRTGYNFLGWSEYKTSTVATYDESFYKWSTLKVDRSLSLYAIWQKQSYTVLFSNVSTPSQTVKYNEKATRPADPVIAKKTFDGWYRDSSFTNKWNFDTDLVTSTLSLYAKFIDFPTYRVNYVTNIAGEWKGCPSDATKYYENDSATVKTVSDTVGLVANSTGTKKYKFLGWSLSQSAVTPSYVANNAITIGKEDVTLFAVWELEGTFYKIIYSSAETLTSGSVPVDSVLYAKDDWAPIASSSGTKRDGYRLVSWMDQDHTGTYYESEDKVKIGSANIRLQANWKKFHTITYVTTMDYHYAKAVTITDTHSYIVGEHPLIKSMPADARKSQYSFRGWKKLSSSDVDYEPNTEPSMPDEDLVLYPVWGNY